MARKDQSGYYRPVSGSRNLKTRSVENNEALVAIEEAREDPGMAPLYHYKGEWLGGASVQEGIILPKEVFEVLLPAQSPEEQSLYINLYWQSYGEGFNWCRLGKRELAYRMRVSDRKLNRALDGLVTKGHIAPLHRSHDGTLYRVFLPSEILNLKEEGLVTWGEPREELPKVKPAKGGKGSPDEPFDEMPEIKPPPGHPDGKPTGSLAKKPAKPKRRRARKVGPEREGAEGKAARKSSRRKPLESPLNDERFAEATGKQPRGPGLGEMADAYFESLGREPGASDRQVAIAVLTDLLEDGFTRDEVGKALEWFINNRDGEDTIERLPYYIAKALEQS